MAGSMLGMVGASGVLHEDSYLGERFIINYFHSSKRKVCMNKNNVKTFALAGVAPFVRYHSAK